MWLLFQIRLRTSSYHPFYVTENNDGIGYASMNAEEYHQTHHVPSGEEARSSKAAAERSKGEFYEQPGIDNVWGGIPAKNHRGENLLLFIGIIDILQSYGMLKKVSITFKYNKLFTGKCSHFIMQRVNVF